MDAETRQSRARLIRDITVQIHDSEAKCQPLAAMRIAILAGITGSQTEEAGRISPLMYIMAPGAPVPEHIPPGFFVWENAPQWLGLDAESTMEMLRPEREEADWRAKPNTAGYVSIRAIRKMLDVYGETGTVQWPSWKDLTGSWESVCEENGIEWAAWEPGPIRGWRQPGTERIAIVKFKEGQEPGLGRFDIEQQFSDLARCEVSLTSPERMDSRQREAELSRTEVFYARSQ